MQTSTDQDDLVSFATRGVVVLRAERESVQVAREWVTNAFANWPNSVQRDAAQIVSELVTNAVEHTDTKDVLVQAFAGITDPMVEVWDWDLNPPVLREPDYLAERGRGMNIVDKFAQSWGCILWHNSKAVWAVLKSPQS